MLTINEKKQLQKEKIRSFFNKIDHYHPELTNEQKCKILRTYNSVERVVSNTELNEFIELTKVVNPPIVVTRAKDGKLYIKK